MFPFGTCCSCTLAGCVECFCARCTSLSFTLHQPYVQRYSVHMVLANPIICVLGYLLYHCLLLLAFDQMLSLCLHRVVDPQVLTLVGQILYHTGGGETTLQWDDRLQMWYMLFVQQQDHNKIIMHYSRDVQGPWESKHLYSPAAPFTDTENYMCYAVSNLHWPTFPALPPLTTLQPV